MRVRSDAPQLVLFLGGAATLTVLAVTQLPPLPELLQAPDTPFDRSAASSAAPVYRLFWEAASLIPPGASVAPVSEPRDPVRETTLHRAAVALFPGRRVLPAAIWNTPTHAEDQADFLIVVGGRPARAPGELVLENRAGTLWRRHGR